MLLRLDRRFMVLRETGKASFLQAMDVARAAARAIGVDLARRGVLAEPDDVFYLTIAEVTGEPPAGARDLVGLRKERRRAYQQLRLPESWKGMPEPIPADDVEAPGTAGPGAGVTGLGVSPGVVEGPARVILDPSDPVGLAEGEILVCHTTDPSWAPLFLPAAGLVIDIGAAISHGAIVAREPAIPCVINTRVGTRPLRTGDRLRVDGSMGTVEVLEPAPGAERPPTRPQ